MKSLALLSNIPTDTGLYRFLVSTAVLFATIMVVLDVTIVNVSLSDMMASLGATPSQITLVLTSYIVTQAIFIPLTGFLSESFGRRTWMLASVFGFVLFSALCGQATSLNEMVVFRVLQGVFGASIIPMSQGILISIFPVEKRSKAMALWGFGVALGPVLGPTLGGYITDIWSWRWIFYINIPVGLVTFILIAGLLKSTARKKVNPDWLGALFMVIGVGSLQYIFDQGQHRGWFESHVIVLSALICFFALALFIVRSWRNVHSVVNLQLLSDKHLSVACFLVFIFMIGMFGTIASQPLMMEGLYGFSPRLTGLLMAPRGLGVALGMLLAPFLLARLSSRKVIVLGIGLCIMGTLIMTRYNLIMNVAWFVYPSVLQGLGLGLVFVPLSSFAYKTLSLNNADAGAGLYNFFRNLGTSVGISVAATIVARQTAINGQSLGARISEYNPLVHIWLDKLNMTLDMPLAQALLGHAVQQQAGLMSYVNLFYFVTFCFMVMLPLVLLVDKDKPS